MKEGYVAVPGGKIWYQIHTNNDSHYKTPIIMLHGGPGTPHNYLLNLAKLRKYRTVVFYDQLGCGNSFVEGNHKELWTLLRFVSELDALTKTREMDQLLIHKIELFNRHIRIRANNISIT